MHRNWKTLIKPNNLEAVELNDVYGKFVAKPLERGYGVHLVTLFVEYFFLVSTVLQ